MLVSFCPSVFFLFLFTAVHNVALLSNTDLSGHWVPWQENGQPFCAWVRFVQVTRRDFTATSLPKSMWDTHFKKNLSQDLYVHHIHVQNSQPPYFLCIISCLSLEQLLASTPQLWLRDSKIKAQKTKSNPRSHSMVYISKHIIYKQI